MMSHKQRILKVARGEWADTLPFAPRIDLWYQANHAAGTLPPRHGGRTVDQIALAEGWALHKVIPDWQSVRSTEDTMHRGIGIFAVKEGLFRHRFSSSIEVKVKVAGSRTRVEYHTPIGMVSTTTLYTEEMKRAGASTIWIDEHIIKKPEDYRIVGSLFENIELLPDFDGFLSWQKEIGDNGLAVALGCRAASPMHHIQKDFLDATTFFYHYRDWAREMQDLAASMAHYYDQMLKIMGESPAEAVLWGANYDDMITFPPYFEKAILPWIRKAADVLEAKGKLLVSHCDGENLGLMDLIRESGIHVAEAVTPHPMTKVTIEEYYSRWAPHLAIFGGIPSNLLLAECATEHEFKAYLDYLFKAVVPGKRFIVGIGDCVPPKAVFERLLQIGERIEKAGRLPLQGRAARPLSHDHFAQAKARVLPQKPGDASFKIIRDDILNGNEPEIARHIQEMLNRGVLAEDILHSGMIAAMEVVAEKFKAQELFIPEVLLSARAMNTGLSALEPYLANSRKEERGKVLMATVSGDMHDIGKNMVMAMLRGVGFEIRDLGINVPTDTLVKEVSDYNPNILGLSALLTTTMPEMEKVIDALTVNGLRNRVKVIVGGAPVNDKFAKSIGADGYAPDAGTAVQLAKDLMNQGK